MGASLIASVMTTLIHDFFNTIQKQIGHVHALVHFLLLFQKNYEWTYCMQVSHWKELLEIDLEHEFLGWFSHFYGFWVGQFTTLANDQGTLKVFSELLTVQTII